MIKCEICGNNTAVSYFGKDDRIQKCQKCGVGFLNPELIQYYTIDYYEDAPTYIASLNNQDRLELIAQNSKDQLNFITRYFKPTGKMLLDVGAHTGIFVKEANNIGFQAEGIEPNKTVAEWASHKGFPIREGQIEAYNPNKIYDVITLSHVLEHLRDPISKLKKLKSWLKDGGYFVVEVPNSGSYLAKLDGISWKYIALEHLNYFSEDSLKKILENLGFKIIASKKRNLELKYLNPKKLLRHLIGKKVVRDRLQPKNKDQVVTLNSNTSLIKKLAVGFMYFLINVLGRQDHILILAKKIKNDL